MDTPDGLPCTCSGCALAAVVTGVTWLLLAVVVYVAVSIPWVR
jgi:hypothetical protein